MGTGQVRIWEHWKQSGKSIEEYVAWLAAQPLTFMSFQRTARHDRVTYEARIKRPDGSFRKVIRVRAFGKRELELLDAVYAKFGHHYGWFKERKRRIK